MSLKEEMWKYEQITGESAEHVPIIKLGAFLDGYEMGLKALEQQPNEDCISRQAVLDIINFEDEWLHDANSHNADTKIAFNGLESRVKELPSVTPKAGWIPVSERLPEEFQCVLVTTGSRVDVCTYLKGSAYWKSYVLAWMPLPTSYQGEENG